MRGTATELINVPAHAVFDALTTVERMGEWSPECTGGEWLSPSTEAAVGARFVGHNKSGLLKWSTESVVTALQVDRVFEFSSEGGTVWRYEFEPLNESTRVTESFTKSPGGAMGNFIDRWVLRREKGMIAGMQATLTRLKTVLEAERDGGR